MKSLDDLSPADRDEVIADARNAIHSKGFQFAIDMLRDKYYFDLIQAPVGDLTATTAHASMKVLEDVKKTFENIAKDVDVVRRRNRS